MSRLPFLLISGVLIPLSTPPSTAAPSQSCHPAGRPRPVGIQGITDPTGGRILARTWCSANLLSTYFLISSGISPSACTAYLCICRTQQSTTSKTYRQCGILSRIGWTGEWGSIAWHLLQSKYVVEKQVYSNFNTKWTNDVLGTPIQHLGNVVLVRTCTHKYKVGVNV